MIFVDGTGVHFNAATVFDTARPTTPCCSFPGPPLDPGDRGLDELPSPTCSCLFRRKLALRLLMKVDDRSTRFRILDGDCDRSPSDGLRADADTGDLVGVDMILANVNDDNDEFNDSNPSNFCLNDQLSGDVIGDKDSDFFESANFTGDDSLNVVCWLP